MKKTAVSLTRPVTRSKPDPEVFLKAAMFLGERPGNCLVVEDAEAGIDAAKNGGMKAAGIGEASKYVRTDYPLQKISELLELDFG